MELPELIQKRYSCRNYTTAQVTNDIINTILDMARFAPSAVNFQPWEIIVVTQKQELEKVWDCYDRSWIQTAPVAFIICANHNKSWKRSDGKDFSDIDAAIFTDHLTLAATQMGLATCWVCNFNSHKLNSNFNLPAEVEPLIILPLGYPADDKVPEKKRKPLNDTVHWNKY